MTDRLRWGIMGTGNIARQFAEGVAGSARSTIVAVASRSDERAAEFAKAHGITTAHGDYTALLDDENVEAIYLALPNSMHHAWVLRAAAAGKHILCEKPFAMDFDEAEQMFDAAEQAGVLLVEAFMYRTHPQTAAVMQQLRSGVIGDLRLVRASFCYRTKKIDGNVRFDRELGGGGLMDIGCYCIDFIRMAAQGNLVECLASAVMHDRGVDELAAGTLRFDNGILGSFTCGMSAQTDNTAYLCGTEGFIEIPIPWKPPQTGATYIVNAMTPPKQDAGLQQRKPREKFMIDAPCPLYGMEADAFAACVRDGAEPFMTKQDTLGNMEVLDELRAQIGLRWG